MDSKQGEAAPAGQPGKGKGRGQRGRGRKNKGNNRASAAAAAPQSRADAPPAHAAPSPSSQDDAAVAAGSPPGRGYTAPRTASWSRRFARSSLGKAAAAGRARGGGSGNEALSAADARFYRGDLVGFSAHRQAALATVDYSWCDYDEDAAADDGLDTPQGLPLGMVVVDVLMRASDFDMVLGEELEAVESEFDEDAFMFRFKVHARELYLVDRQLAPSTIVALPDVSKTGEIVAVDTRVQVVIPVDGRELLLADVKEEDLVLAPSYIEDAWVRHNSSGWIGRIDSVSHVYTFEFLADPHRRARTIEMTEDGPGETFEPCLNMAKSCLFADYEHMLPAVGRRYAAGDELVNIAHSGPRNQRVNIGIGADCIVVGDEVKDFVVSWLHNENDDAEPLGDAAVKPQDATVLDPGPAWAWTVDLGVRVRANVSADDANVLAAKQEIAHLKEQLRSCHKRQRQRIKEQLALAEWAAGTRIGIVTRVETAADIRWQDGSIEKMVDTTSVVPYTVESEQFFLPEQIVRLKRANELEYDNEDASDGEDARLAVVLRVDSNARTADINWILDDGERCGEETVSVYDLRLSSLYEGFTLQSSVYASFPNAERTFGTVTAITNGAMEVLWSSGVTSTHSPGELIGLDQLEDLNDDQWEDEEGDGWYTTDSDEAENVSSRAAVNELAEQMANVADIAEPAAAPAQPPPATPDSTGALAAIAGLAPLELPTAAEAGDAADEAADSVAASAEPVAGAASLEPFAFIETAPASHVGFGDPHEVGMKTLRREWQALRKGMPPGVFVRAFEDRTDLMRAAIIGPPNSPYHDALFFFDISLPQDYPQSPPSVKFTSMGERLNPNLYTDGTVCLSLLGTWSGDGIENWTPGRSNLLQVLVSIQGLVLVSEPYYNEAGYERQVGTREGEVASVMYNENALLVTMQTIPRTLARPVAGFEDLIRVHFLHRREAVLERMERIVHISELAAAQAADGDDAGVSAQRAAGVSSPLAAMHGLFGTKPEHPPSAGFVLSLKRMVPVLRDALAALE